MSRPIALAGFTGCGKSSSLKYLDPTSTFIVSCTPKQLTFPGFRKNYKKLTKTGDGYTGNWYHSTKFDQISKILDIVNKMPEIKVLVLDDINYLLTYDTFDKASEKGYDKFTNLAKSYFDLIHKAETLRDDLTVVFVSHLENTGTEMDPIYRLFTTGKMLSSKGSLDGLFNYIIYAVKLIDGEDVSYKFQVHSKGQDSCKTPEGCFEEDYIDPNMQIVLEAIDKYEFGE